MAKKTDIKICRYIKCSHPDKKIDITKDDYKSIGNQYYHSDCIKSKRAGEWKDEETKKDLQYIKNKWIECISDTVIYSQLFRILNDFISRGIQSKYLVFVLDYVIEHKMNLHYPNGFKYYVDKEEIKEAYKKYQNKKNGLKNQAEFNIQDDLDSPKFEIKSKKVGFNSILGGK